MYSLRLRYLIVAISSVLCVLLAIVFEHVYISDSSERLKKNIESRVQVRQLTESLRQEMQLAARHIDLYLIEPTADLRLQFKNALQNADDRARQLENDKWVISKELRFDIGTLRIKLAELDKNADQLMKIRLEPNAMFPAMKLANGTMLVVNADFLTSINYAIAESESMGLSRASKEIYQLKLQIRDLWRQTINTYRIYLINRLGSMFEDALPNQVKDIHTYFGQLRKLLKKLESMKNHPKMGFESSESVSLLINSAEEWYKGFQEVETINKTKAWRGDVPIIINNVYPLIDNIHQLVNQLNSYLIYTAAEDVKAQYKTSQQISMLLWGLFALLVSVMIFSYFLLDNALLKPIYRLAEAFKNGSSNIDMLIPHVHNKEMSEFIGAFSNLRQQIKHRQDQLEHLAMHDSLTSLPNRTLLVDRMTYTINMSKRKKAIFALIIMDLDRFKEVNDTLGHLVGDNLLCEVAERLQRMLRDTDTVARLGGDEFAIILTDITHESINDMANKVSEELGRVYQIDAHNLYLGASLGIAIYPNHGSTADQLMKHADVAMYEAKRSTAHYSIYAPENDVNNIKQLSLLSDLRLAIDNNELVLQYQPINSLKDSSILGFEALVRWQHPSFGRIGPDIFIHLAEQTGLIRKITQWVVQEAIKQASKWHAINPGIYVSINVTAWDLYEVSFVESIYKNLTQNNLPPSVILLELSERSMMTETVRVGEVLNRLDAMGIRFAIDDFGTGFSSLSYLKQLPISILKIDKSFVFGMAAQKNDRLIVNSIIDLAHNLEMEVIAEGVEDEITQALLKEETCDSMQGFLISKPVDADIALNMLQRPPLRVIKNNIQD